MSGRLNYSTDATQLRLEWLIEDLNWLEAKIEEKGCNRDYTSCVRITIARIEGMMKSTKLKQKK